MLDRGESQKEVIRHVIDRITPSASLQDNRSDLAQAGWEGKNSWRESS